jgi:hypothetical protein
MLHTVKDSRAIVKWDALTQDAETAIQTISDAKRLTALRRLEIPRDAIELWFALRRSPWASLAIVPADDSASGLPMAELVSQVGSIQLGSLIEVVDARGVNLWNAPDRIAELREKESRGSLVLAAMSSVLQDPAGIPIACAVDACLLYVSLGETDLTSARRTLDLVGRDRFIGCVTARIPKKRAPRSERSLDEPFLWGGP